MWRIWFLEFLWGVGTPIGDHSFFFITINGWSDDLMSTRGTFLGNSREDRTPFWNQEPSRRRQKERVVLDAEDTCTLPNRCWPEEGWVSLKIARPFRSTETPLSFLGTATRREMEENYSWKITITVTLRFSLVKLPRDTIIIAQLLYNWTIQ